MAIRTENKPKITKQGVVTEQSPGPVAADPLPALKAQIDRALKDGNFSQKESRDLEAALQANPAHKGAVTDYLKDELSKRVAAGKPIGISEMALSTLGKSVGIDLKELFFRRQAQSTVVDHDVAQGLQKTAKSTADEHSAELHKAGSDARLDKQKQILDGKNGVVDRPVGGVKGAAYDAAGDLAAHLEGKLDGKLGVEALEAKKVLREPLIKTGTAIVAEMKKGDTLKKLGDVTAQIGKPGFTEALSTAAGHMSADIVNATNMTAVNVDAVNGAINGVKGAVTALTGFAKGTKLEPLVAQTAPKVLKAFVDVGGKLTAGAKVAEGASVVAKGAQVAEIAAEGAQVAGAGAKAAGQSVPIVGQVLGVVTTGLAVAELIGHCRHKPRDGKRIIAAGANVVGQVVGIFIPFVGAATTVGKLASDAAMNANDKKHGKETAHVGIKDLAPLVSDTASLVSPFIEGAGGDPTAINRYAAQIQTLADNGLTSADVAAMSPAQREAMVQMVGAAGAEMHMVADE